MINPSKYIEVNENSERYKDTEKVLKEHRPLLRWGPNEVILDVGCGPGDIVDRVLKPWLPSDFKYILGVDISTKMIDFAQEVYSNDKMGFKAVDMEGDVRGILQNEKCSGGFDKVFSFYVLHWFENLQKAMDNIYYLMKPGGQAVINFPCDSYVQSARIEARKKPEWSIYFKDVVYRLTPFLSSPDPVKDLTRILETSGFKEIRCRVDEFHTRAHSSQVLTGLVESLDPDIARVPADKKDQYVKDCVQVLKNRKQLDESGTALLRSMLICSFTKPQ